MVPSAFIASLPWSPSSTRTPRLVWKRHHSLIHESQSKQTACCLRMGQNDQANSPRKQRKREFDRNSPSDEWLDFLAEFEQRANNRTRHSLENVRGALNGKGGRWTDGYLEYLPYVQTAFMAALTTQFWYIGRILRLDAFLLLLYPLPCMFISARWGLTHSDRCLSASIFMIFVSMGPMFAQFYFFNSGLLTFVYSRTLWWQWPWWACLTAGAAAKGVGLLANLIWANFVFKTNMWLFLTDQTRAMLIGGSKLLSKIPFMPMLGIPTVAQVRVGIIVVVAIHSFYHVFCTLFLSSLLLVRVSENVQLARVPKGMPLLVRIIRKTRDPNLKDIP